MTTYSVTEMLNLYRNRLGLSKVLMLPAEQERQPIDRELLSVLRSRYLHLLATEDLDLLPVADVGGACTAHFLASGVLHIVMPDRCIRPVSLRLECWNEPVYAFHRTGSALHRRQRLPLLRGSVANPVVFRYSDRLLVYGARQEEDSVPQIELMAVAPPDDGSFRLSSALLPKMLEASPQ